MLTGAVLAIAAICVTTIAVVLSSRAKPPMNADAARQWEDQNHNRIIELKSDAEALAIEGNLRDAHTKYRELEKLVGGRKLKDATLFDIMEAARADQDRVYKMLLRALGDVTPAPGVLTPVLPADMTPPDGLPPAPSVNGERAASAPYPPEYESLRVRGAQPTEGSAADTQQSASPPAGAPGAGDPRAGAPITAAPIAGDLSTGAPTADEPKDAAPRAAEPVAAEPAPTPREAAPSAFPRADADEGAPPAPSAPAQSVAAAAPAPAETTAPAAPDPDPSATGPVAPIIIPAPDDRSIPTTKIAGREYALPPQLDAVNDAALSDALMRGNEFLLSHFKDGELVLNEPMSETDKAGVAALCTYALLQSGRASDDPRLGIKSPEMVQLLEKMSAVDLSTRGGFDLPATYARSIRAATLAVYNRPQDRELLREDVAWLINAATDGAYSYDDRYAATPAPAAPKRSAPATRPAPAVKPRGILFEHSDRAPVILIDGIFTPMSPGASYTGPIGPSPGAGYNTTPSGYTPGAGYKGPAPGYSQDSNTGPSAGYGKRVRVMIPERPMFQNVLRNRPPPPPRRQFGADTIPWDNSNSQYGVLGVWAGAEVGVEVPEKYWRAVEQHWMRTQLPSGEWAYSPGWQGSFPMTTAGVATLFVTHDYLDAPLLGSRGLAGVRPYNDSLTSALAWLEDGDNSVNVMQEPALDAMRKGQALFYMGYNLFGIERVGLASGFKHLGGHDWFVELVAKVLPLQSRDGAFGRSGNLRDTLIDTAFVMLFLSRGRHPVMMNKLRFEGEWTNRPRDIANLTAYATRELERQLNWQVVDIRRDPDDWADSPILYLASQRKLQFSEQEMGKLAQFVDEGGIIFTHADLGSEEFNKSVVQLTRRLFPMYELMPLSSDHELYKLNYNLKTPRPRLQGVSNGVRLLLVHSPADLAAAWQLRATVSQKDAHHLGANLYLYATGKERFRNRLDTTMIPQPPGEPQRTVPVARLLYAGNWDPEPGAWPRIARKLEWETGVRMALMRVDADEVLPDAFPIAHLTGTTAIAPGEGDIAALRNYVSNGGTLLIDASGGAAAFAEGETTWLPKLLGDAKLEPVGPDDPLLKRTIDGTVDMPPKALRLYAITQLQSDGGRLKAATVGKGRVIFSSIDITTGLLGTNTWGIVGYLPEYSEALVRNLLVLSAEKWPQGQAQK